MIWIKSGTPLEVEYGLIVGNSEFDRKQHWERVYGDKPTRQASWHQDVPHLSLAMIANAGLDHNDAIIDVGGGASTLVDHLLDLGYRNLTVLDISRAVLDQASERLGERASMVNWVEADVTRFLPDRKFKLWHDRALFHFLTVAGDRLRYMRVLRKSLEQTGRVVIAAFAPGGPVKCSGLGIVQYDAVKLGDELGQEFVLQERQEESHITPSKGVQLFNFFRFRRGA